MTCMPCSWHHKLQVILLSLPCFRECQKLMSELPDTVMRPHRKQESWGSSCMCCRQDENGELYYTCEFTVQSPNFFRHNLSVYAVR